jgi:hypothetical protein
VFGGRDLTHGFHVSPDALWDALTVSLPVLTQKATWYDHDHRVEWVVSLTGWSWTQVMHASVEPATSGGALLRFAGRSPYRAALGDKRRRRKMFDTLVAAITDALAHPMTVRTEAHSRDESRWWNGHEWTVDPPPA